MFVYAISFSILGAQFIFADVMHVELTNFQGQPITTNIFNSLHQDTLNQIAINSTSQSPTWQQQVTNSLLYLGAAAKIAWNLLLLITGFYVFAVMIDMGVPVIFVMMFIGLYIILLARSIPGWIRSI